MTAVPIHHTKTYTGAWDGPEQVSNLKTPLTKVIGENEFAWVDPSADQTTKAAWRYPHHFVTNHKPGAASTIGCSAGIAALNGGATIPDADRKGVHAHLAAHLIDSGVKEEDVPELKSFASPITTGRARLYSEEFRAEMRTATEVRCIREMDPDYRIAHRFEMREVDNGTGGTSLRFTGYASVVEKPYEVSDMFGPYQETIARNAFNKTLSDGADVSFLANHGGITMARTKAGTLQLSSDSTGLYTEATLNPSRPDVQIIRAAVQDGDLDEMSFAFRVTRQEWDADYTKREIQEVNMHQGDVSIVNFGANPATAGTVALRSRSSMTAQRTAGTTRLALPDHVEHARNALARARRGTTAQRSTGPQVLNYEDEARAALARAKRRGR